MLASDEELKSQLLRAIAGDASAYENWLLALSRLLRGYFRRRLSGLPGDIEDLVQEVLLAVHLQRHTYDSTQPLTPWVYAIARYKMVDFLRRRSRTDALNDPIEDNAPLFAVDDGEAAMAQRDITGLLEELPVNQRLPIVMTKLEGRSVAETAQLTGMSESAVKVGVHRGLKALAARLKEK